MRYVLVHEYFDLATGVIWATATVSLPEVVTILRGLLTPEDRRT
ncbi:DUF86 domain-containing protein [Myxococcota bacterium]|nr:DUF86 domain-containing protein [Myxococcota bacterium]